jgi:hypothetical protein
MKKKCYPIKEIKIRGSDDEKKISRVEMGASWD